MGELSGWQTPDYQSNEREVGFQNTKSGHLCRQFFD